MALKLDDIPKLTKVVLDTLKSKKTLDSVGKELVDRIQKRTRLGKGVQEPLAEPTELKKLEPQTVRRRRNLKKSGKLTGPRATPAKAGLNQSGQLIDSIKHIAKKGELNIVLNNQEAKNKALRVMEIDKKNTFMNVSMPEFKSALRSIKEILTINIKKVFK